MSGASGRWMDGASTTVGVVGQLSRADVTPWGDLVAWTSPPGAVRPGPALRWFVAAEDRWHDPSTEASVRQRRIDGTPVVETRVRVPGGDAVQRTWAAPDRGGITLVEVTNESPRAFAVAFSGPTVLTDRPPAAVPIEGIELPDDAFVLPIGHRSSVRVGIPHDPTRWAGATLAEVHSDPAAVVRGWSATAARASRLDLPDELLVTAVTEARCDLLLHGPVDRSDDPVGFVLDVAELVRLGEPADRWLPELVEPIGEVARAGTSEAAAVLIAAGRVARAADDPRATGDIDRLRVRVSGPDETAVPPFSEIVRTASHGRFVADVERRLARGGEVLPVGIPTTWLGVGFEVHHLQLGPSGQLSFAVRWHGERPAVLWERTGDPITLTAGAVDPVWSSDEVSGEALWAVPPRPRTMRVGSARPETGVE